MNLADLVIQNMSQPAMLEKSQADYEKSIRDAIRAFWEHEDFGLFFDDMLLTIERNLSQAWFEGMAACGFVPEDITYEEDIERLMFINTSISFVASFASDIMGYKRDEKSIEMAYTRAEVWANRWSEAYNRAQQLVCGDQKLVWVLGSSEEHCSSCLRLAGVVKRSSVWEASGIRPQSPDLECGGWRCQCQLVPTDMPGTPGPLPFI